MFETRQLKLLLAVSETSISPNSALHCFFFVCDFTKFPYISQAAVMIAEQHMMQVSKLGKDKSVKLARLAHGSSWGAPHAFTIALIIRVSPATRNVLQTDHLLS
jgi:hypothetical protein